MIGYAIIVAVKFDRRSGGRQWGEEDINQKETVLVALVVSRIGLLLYRLLGKSHEP